VSCDLSESANSADITYTYDRLGRQATVTDATGTRSFGYDTASLQLDTETLPSAFYGSLVLNRSYDTLGRNAGYSLGGTLSSVSATYGYESTGRLATVTDPANGGRKTRDRLILNG
jgi:YD repeat-containing protein